MLDSDDVGAILLYFLMYRADASGKTDSCFVVSLSLFVLLNNGFNSSSGQAARCQAVSHSLGRTMHTLAS